ncbi:inter-alpha-trypsin inhibitor heavy chain-related [Zea mays]|uniref:Inter-alpha-trypsin inhibitor heavy chain-related n=1 Tax=Zea mays TaxID=4577 RepID=A0A1D6IJH9_MAIZE|nr:inter-alpha-trypsin inhibitor heavy chain-related [Zea mays]
MEDFARAVEDGLKLSKRLVLPGGVPPPRPPAGMERTVSAASASGPDPRLLPTAPMAYALVTDPAAVDTPDVPSYQPYVYGDLDPPALIPLQMKEVDLAVDCALDAAHVTLRARWWLHCITRSRDSDVRLVVPLGEQVSTGSILGAEVTVGRRSYNTQVIEVEDHTLEKHAKIESGGLLQPHLFFLTIPQVEGGADICATFQWSQKLLYDSGRFSVDIPFRFPYFVNPLPKVFMKKEKIQLTVHSGFSKEILLQGTSHPLKEKSRQGDKLFFHHEAIVENWSIKDFNFSYNVYSGDLSGGVLVQPATLCDYDDRDMFCIFLLPGSGNRKVFGKAVVFIVDTSGSMQGKPLENVKHAVSTALSELVEGDYFNIITFNDELHSFSSCLEQVNDKAIASATEWMNANFVAEGGTDIMHPLSEAMALLSSVHDTLPQIYLITDGSVDDEHNICRTTKTDLSNRGSRSPRISTFGLGSYCNHYFLRMLASIGKGHYDAALGTASIENQILKWFRRASSTIVANISIDALTHLDEFEVDSEYIPDLSANSPLCVSGKYKGKFPDTIKAKGYLADMKEISVELKVQQLKEIPLDKVLVIQQIDFMTSKAWMSADKQVERKVIKLSTQNGVPSEYTDMIFLQTNLDKVEGTQKVKQKLKGHKGRDEQQIYGLKLGFGNKDATRENLITGFGDMNPAEKSVMLQKGSGCCSRVADCLCCMCCIKACNRMNDQCAVLMAQICAALACLGCYECCAEVCCGGSES